MMKYSIFAFALVLLFCGQIFAPQVVLSQTYDAPEDQVKLLLSAREAPVDISSLEQLAGGQEELISILLELRIDEQTPFVSVRSEKLLLKYSSIARVAEVLESDAISPDYSGLARVIALHIDQVPGEKLRHSLAEQLLARAQNEPAFVPYAKSLASSEDTKIRDMAQRLLK